MASKHTIGMERLNSSNANFRAWAQWVHDRMIDGGWTQTADTGQLDIASATAPASNPTQTGYRIYTSNDGLGALYVKMTFGGINTTGLCPAIWLKFGGGSDGAGNLSPEYVDIQNPAVSWSGHSVSGLGPAQAGAPLHSGTASDSFASVTPGRFAFCLLTSLETSPPDRCGAVFSVERVRDWDGNPVAGKWAYLGNGGFYSCGYAVTFGSGISSVGTNTLATYTRPSARIAHNNRKPDRGTVEVGYVFPPQGASDWQVEAPYTNWLVVGTDHLLRFGNIEIKRQGVTRPYQQIGEARMSNVWGADDASVRLLMRFD